MKSISIVLMFITVSVYGQNYNKISGKVITGDKNKVVAFASVSISGTFIGVVTNEVGCFELKFPDNLLNDTLVFSNIGYKTFRLPVKEYMAEANDIIKLQAEDYNISEVFITPEAKHPELIVRKAVMAKKDNYPRNAFYLDIFFRETEYSENTYLRLMEAAIGIGDYGFDSNIERSRIKLLELRKSYDFNEYKSSWKFLNRLLGEKNILYETYRKDLIRNHKASGSYDKFIYLFSKKGLKFYTFTLDDILYQDSTIIYVINYEPNGFFSATEKRKRPLIDKKGQLYINKSDYAVVRATVNYFLNGPYHSGFSNGSEETINYRKVKGKYYLSSLELRKSFSGTPGYTENGKYKHQMTKSSFYVTNIYTSKKEFDRIKHREKQPKDINLYKIKVPYNEFFWNRYNTVLRNPLLQKVKNDIEKNETLEKQFKENGSK